MADVILAVLIFAPAVLTYFLRSNAALSFLALCGAFTLITLGSAELKDLTGQLNIQVDASTLNLVLLMVPLLATLLLTRKAFSGQMKTIMHLATALCAGGLLALVSVPLLNASARTNFADSWGWANLQKIQVPLIAAGFLLSLLLVWFNKSRHPKKHK
ncbi:MAG TPA: hypothetical protein VJJ78_03885 [Candidatus Saccharimonadales bacterium]|nr:hypothetical protein [Candidatus Saccharimonadales bacterium]